MIFYYTPNEENEMKTLVTQLERTMDPKKAHVAGRLQDAPNANSIMARYHDTMLLTKPVALMMMAEVLYAAQNRHWTFEAAQNDTHYKNFTALNREKIVDERRKDFIIRQKMMRRMNEALQQPFPQDRASSDTPSLEEAYMFTPAYHLQRRTDEAYALHLSTALGYREHRRISPWSRLILDRGAAKPSKEIIPAMFYCPEQNMDLVERANVKEFFE